jgi:hypothetical protein
MKFSMKQAVMLFVALGVFLALATLRRRGHQRMAAVSYRDDRQGYVEPVLVDMKAGGARPPKITESTSLAFRRRSTVSTANPHHGGHDSEED